MTGPEKIEMLQFLIARGLEDGSDTKEYEEDLVQLQERLKVADVKSDDLLENNSSEEQEVIEILCIEEDPPRARIDELIIRLGECHWDLLSKQRDLLAARKRELLSGQEEREEVERAVMRARGEFERSQSNLTAVTLEARLVLQDLERNDGIGEHG